MKKIYSLISGSFAALALICLPLMSFSQSGNDCANAIDLDVGLGECNNVVASNIGATDSGIGNPLCGAYAGGDIWFSIEVPASGDVTITASSTGSNLTDMAMEVYSGACGSLTAIECDDDGGPGFFPEIELTGQTPGNTIYARIWDLGGDDFGTFAICAEGAADCVLPEANYTTTTDCENDQFSVDVELTSLGSATSITISNDEGVAATTGITSTGTYTVGPFSNSADVVITVENEDDSECSISSDPQVGDVCPVTVNCGNTLNDTYCYQNSDSNELVYFSSNGSPLTLEFNSGLIEECCDNIVIYDGDNTGAPELYNGTGTSGDLSGVSATSTGGSITLVVQSDGSGSCEDGFLNNPFDFDVSCEGTFVDCSTATQISVAPTFAETQMNGDVQGVTPTNVDQCNGESGAADQWYRYNAAASTTFINAVGNGDFDAVIEVYEDCNQEPLFCVNDAGAGEEEFVIVGDQNPGQEYYYRIYHDGSSDPSTTTYTTATAHVPFVQLRAQDCGVLDYGLNDIIRSTQPANYYLFEYFVWEFTELEAPFNTYEVIPPTTANPNFSLSWFDQAEPGRTYEVRIRTRQYEGPTDGDYSASCVIGIESDVQTSLAAQFDGGTYQFCDILFAQPVPNADQYRFVFDDGENTFEYINDSYNFLLRQVPGLQYNTTYDVEVFVTLNQSESTTSTTRTISTGGIPQTAVNQNITTCGSTVAPNAILYAQNVCRATAYEWRFVNTTQTQPDIFYTRTGGPYNIQLSQVNGLIAGDSYDVQIRAIYNQQEGVFGDACNLTIEGGMGIAQDNGDPVNSTTTAKSSVEAESLELFPNPSNGEQVRIVLDRMNNKDQSINVEVFDLSGKVVHSEQIANSGEKMNVVLNFDRNLQAGLYMVNVSWDGNEMTRKLIVR